MCPMVAVAPRDQDADECSEGGAKKAWQRKRKEIDALEKENKRIDTEKERNGQREGAKEKQQESASAHQMRKTGTRHIEDL